MSTEQEQKQTPIIDLSEGKMLVVDGSLSLKCTQALMEVYKKETSDEVGFALESQAEDLVNQVGMWQALAVSNNQPKDADIGIFYATKGSETGVSDVVRMLDATQDMSPEQKAISALMIDRSEGTNYWASALEKFALSKDIQVIGSVKDYCVAL
jgi:hypothetical protein